MPEHETAQDVQIEQTTRAEACRNVAMIVKRLVVLVLAGSLSGLVIVSPLVVYLLYIVVHAHRRRSLSDGLIIYFVIYELLPGGPIVGGALGIFTAPATFFVKKPFRVLRSVICWETIATFFFIGVYVHKLVDVHQSPEQFDPFQMAAVMLVGALFGLLLTVFAKILDRILPPWSRSLPWSPSLP